MFLSYITSLGSEDMSASDQNRPCRADRVPSPLLSTNLPDCHLHPDREKWKLQPELPEFVLVQLLVRIDQADVTRVDHCLGLIDQTELWRHVRGELQGLPPHIRDRCARQSIRLDC